MAGPPSPTRLGSPGVPSPAIVRIRPVACSTSRTRLLSVSAM